VKSAYTGEELGITLGYAFPLLPLPRRVTCVSFGMKQDSRILFNIFSRSKSFDAPKGREYGSSTFESRIACGLVDRLRELCYSSRERGGLWSDFTDGLFEIGRRGGRHALRVEYGCRVVQV